MQQASVEETQAAEVRRKHAEAEEDWTTRAVVKACSPQNPRGGAKDDNHQWVRQRCWSGAMAGQKTKELARRKEEKESMEDGPLFLGLHQPPVRGLCAPGFPCTNLVSATRAKHLWTPPF